MKPVRYIVGAIGFLLVWAVIAAIVKVFIIHFLSPGNGAYSLPGHSWTWRDVPGNLLGLVAGIQSFRMSVREPERSNNFMKVVTWAFGLGALALAVFVGYYLYQNL
jgi:hypothetical protein